jgi:hypothetical protein
MTQDSPTAVGAVIRQGTFVISAKDGPVPGSYRVRIYASSGFQAKPSPGLTDRSPRPMVELLPEHYNAKSELLAAVTDARANRFRFDLTSTTSAQERHDFK